MTTEIITGAFRLVNGDPYNPSPNSVGIDKETGKEKVPNYWITVAGDKKDPKTAELIKLIQAEALAGFPKEHKSPNFAWKYADGDTGVDNKGNELKEKDGYSGHMVFTFSSMFPPKILGKDGKVITDPNAIKRGYFVQVLGNVKPNTSKKTQKPGLYLNLTAIKFIAYGPEIVATADVSALATAEISYMPPGAVAAPSVEPDYSFLKS